MTSEHHDIGSSPEERAPEPEGPSGPPGPPRRGDQAAPPPKPFGLRIAFYILVVYFCYIAGTSLLLYLLEGPEKLQKLWENQPEGEPPVLPVLLGFKLQLFLAPVILAVTGLFAATDRRTLADLGVAWPGRLVVGPVAQMAAAGSAAVAILGSWWLLAEQWATFTAGTLFPAEQMEAMGRWLPLDMAGLLLFAATLFALGFTEEVIFRGYVYAVLRDRLPWIHAAGLSGILFALFHPGDPAVLAPSLLNLFLVGLLLAALREGSDSLLLGSLFHGAWNLVLGCVLALPVSGLEMPRLRHVNVEGPLWVTGGDFGPEGSWLLTGFLVAAVLGITAWVEAGGEEEDRDTEGTEESSAQG